MKILFIIVPFLLSACGGDDSDSVNDTISLNDGVYEDANGHSLFFKDDEAYLYVYKPPGPKYDGAYESSDNRAIEILNSYEDNVITKEFTNAQMGDYFFYENADVQLTFSANTVNALIADENGVAFYDNNVFTKNRSNFDFELLAKQFTDYDGNLITVTQENKLSMIYRDCNITSNIEKTSFYYRVNTATIECTDSSNFRNGMYSGVIYKANNSAIMILRNNDWMFRTTFPLS